jgi:hypothetical protein
MDMSSETPRIGFSGARIVLPNDRAVITRKGIGIAKVPTLKKAQGLELQRSTKARQ